MDGDGVKWLAERDRVMRELDVAAWIKNREYPPPDANDTHRALAAIHQARVLWRDATDREVDESVAWLKTFGFLVPDRPYFPSIHDPKIAHALGMATGALMTAKMQFDENTLSSVRDEIDAALASIGTAQFFLQRQSRRALCTDGGAEPMVRVAAPCTCRDVPLEHYLSYLNR